MPIRNDHQKYLNNYKNFREACLLENIPSEEILMLWVAYEIGTVRNAIPFD